MFFTLLLLFIVIPLAELAILIKMGQHFGVGNTILVQVISGLIGATLAKLQGRIVMKKIQWSLAKGRMPAEEMLDGVLIFTAGIVLITPGLITDSMGLLILFPPTRFIFKRWLRKKFDKMIKQSTVRIIQQGRDMDHENGQGLE